MNTKTKDCNFQIGRKYTSDLKEGWNNWLFHSENWILNWETSNGGDRKFKDWEYEDDVDSVFPYYLDYEAPSIVVNIIIDIKFMPHCRQNSFCFSWEGAWENRGKQLWAGMSPRVKLRPAQLWVKVCVLLPHLNSPGHELWNETCVILIFMFQYLYPLN